jgi:hypothetical protein
MIVAAVGLILALEIGTALSRPVELPRGLAGVSEHTVAEDPRPSRPVWPPAWTTGVPQALAARATV